MDYDEAVMANVFRQAENNASSLAAQGVGQNRVNQQVAQAGATNSANSKAISQYYKGLNPTEFDLLFKERLAAKPDGAALRDRALELAIKAVSDTPEGDIISIARAFEAYLRGDAE